MKKYSWILALLLALSLGFFGCPPNPTGGNGDGPGKGDGKDVVSLSPFPLTLTDNFQYGEGYQGLLENTKLFPDGKITEGDIYTMKITFTTSRDLEDVITVGLVDRTPPPTGDHWIPLSYDADDDGWKLEDNDAPAIAATVKEAADKAVVTKVITFTALKSALSAAANANCIAFETKGAGNGYKDGKEGTPGSGEKGAVTLNISEFLFVKGTEEDLEGAEPLGPGGEPLKVTFGAADATTVTVDGGASITYIAGPPTGYKVTYSATGSNNNYGNVIARFKVDLGGALADFESIMLTYQGVSGDIANKNLHVLAAAEEISGYKSDADIKGMIVSAQPNPATQELYQFGKQVNGTAAQEIVLNIENPGALSGVLWFAFYMGAKAKDDNNDSPTSFSISDVRFIPAAK